MLVWVFFYPINELEILKKQLYPNTQLFSSGVFRLPERLHWKACQTKCTMIVWDKKNSTHFNTEKCGAEYCLLFKTSSLGCCGVLVITIAQKAWTQALCRFKSCSQSVRFAMVRICGKSWLEIRLAFMLVNHSTKVVHHRYNIKAMMFRWVHVLKKDFTIWWMYQEWLFH